MSEEPKKVKRKAVSKKLRFEVFKRGYQFGGEYFLDEAERWAKEFDGPRMVMMDEFESIVDAMEGYHASQEY